MQGFKDLIKLLKPSLKQLGFSNRGPFFYLHKEHYWGIIGLQKSDESTATQIIYTINIGVCSQTITDFNESLKSDIKPDFDLCQWKIRIGDLIAQGEDIWWKIDERTNLDKVYQEVGNLLINTVLPEMQKYMSDERLMNLWLAKNSPGLTDVQRQINLCILLKKFAKMDQLKEVLARLEHQTEGSSSSSLVSYVKKSLFNY